MMLFGTPVMVFDDVVPDQYRHMMLEKADQVKAETKDAGKSWLCDVYSTCHDYELIEDEVFHELIKAQMSRANIFLKHHGVKQEVMPQSVWLNAYTAKQFQDVHKHPNVFVSSVYFLSAPEGSAPLVIHNPVQPDMTFDSTDTEHLQLNKPIKAKDNRLVVFLSWTPHSVPQGSNQELRWTIASNYLVTNE